MQFIYGPETKSFDIGIECKGQAVDEEIKRFIPSLYPVYVPYSQEDLIQKNHTDDQEQ